MQGGEEGKKEEGNLENVMHWCDHDLVHVIFSAYVAIYTIPFQI